MVLKGRLGPHGFAVEPDGVMAKCPSKYDAEPERPGAQAGTRKARGHRVVQDGDGQPGSPGAPRRLRRRELRGDDLRRRRAAALDARSSKAASARCTLVTALLVRRLGRDDLRLRRRSDYSIKYVASQLRRRAAALLSSSRRSGAGSTARSCSGRCCCRSSRVVAIRVNRERQRELIPVRRRDRRRRWRCSSSS